MHTFGVKKYTILVADNYSGMQTYLAYCLRHLGQVICVSNGQDALEVIQSTAVDLIISEVDLPIISGAQLCKKLQETIKRIPLVLLTSRNKYEVRPLIEDCRHEGLLYKPFEPKPLRSIAERLLGLGS